MDTEGHDGYFHSGRVIFAMKYLMADGGQVIVWLDREGDDKHHEVRHSDDKRRLVDARPGDTLYCLGQPRVVQRADVHQAKRANPRQHEEWK